jgi:hypothetical protein
MTDDTYNKAIVPAKSNTLQKFRYLVNYDNKEKTRNVVLYNSSKKLKAF